MQQICRHPFIYTMIILITTFSLSAVNVPAQAKKTIYEKLIKPVKAEVYHMPVGLCEDYPEESTTIEAIRNDMEFLKSAGINLLRISFGWDAIEETRGKYNWLFWDDFVKMAVDEYGITLIPYVCYTPKWNSAYGSDSLYYWAYPPKDSEAFKNFLKTLVLRYKKWIKTWEIWNEPDNASYWRGSTLEFSRLLKAGAEAVRQADPRAKTVLGGLAVNTNFFLELFRDHNSDDHIDIVNFHNYYETWSGDPVEDITDYIAEITDIIDNYGGNEALWMAEVGYSTWRMDGRRVSNDYSAYYDYEHSLLYQGVQLFKTLVLIASTGRVSATAWYEIKDLPMSEGVIGDNNNRNLGVAFYNRAPKPAVKALMFFNRIFGRKYRCIDEEVLIEKQSDSDAEFHTFRNSDGSVIVTGWLRTNIPVKRNNDTTGYAEDKRSERITISIPGAAGAVRVFDEVGNLYPFEGARRTQNMIQLKNIELKGGSIFIAEISGKKRK